MSVWEFRHWVHWDGETATEWIWHHSMGCVRNSLWFCGYGVVSSLLVLLLCSPCYSVDYALELFVYDTAFFPEIWSQPREKLPIHALSWNNGRSQAGPPAVLLYDCIRLTVPGGLSPWSNIYASVNRRTHHQPGHSSFPFPFPFFRGYGYDHRS